MEDEFEEGQQEHKDNGTNHSRGGQEMRWPGITSRTREIRPCISGSAEAADERDDDYLHTLILL